MAAGRIISLRHLRSFVEVANSGSFTVAASRLFVTQSSLTATIQQFEEAVGLKLFDRTTRRVVMTQEAACFKEEAEKILTQFDSAINDLRAFAESRKGHVRIAAAPSVISQLLAEAIAVFRQTYPDITITLRDAGAEQLERMVLDGEIDFAITSRHKGSEDLDYAALLEDRYGIVCRPDYPLGRAKEPLRWSDLSSRDYVAFTSDTGIGAFLREKAGNCPAFNELHDEISSTASLYAVLGAGNRYSILPALAARAGNAAGLVFRELCDPVLTRELSLITRRLRSLSPSAQRLLEILMQIIRKQELPPGVSIHPDAAS